MLQLFCRNTNPQSNRCCRQRIVYIKFARDADTHRNLVLAPDIKLHAHKIRLRDIMNVLCLETGALFQAKSGPWARNIFYNIVNIFIIHVDQGTVTLVEQLFLVI